MKISPSFPPEKFLQMDKHMENYDPGSCVIASRVRLYRNLEGECFPVCAGDGDLCRIREEILKAVKSVSRSLRTSFHTVYPDQLLPPERELLTERFLQSDVTRDPRHGAALCVAADQILVFGINGLDHLCLQAVAGGDCGRKLFEKIHKADDCLSKKISYAFSPEFGYLTHSPSYAGTGMFVSFLVHLPGLEMSNQIEKMIHSLNTLSLDCHRIFNEGPQSEKGCFFLITNKSTLGAAEEEIFCRVESAVKRIVLHEMKSRRILLGTHRDMLLHKVSCAYGLLRHGYSLTEAEAFDALGMLLLGLDLKLFHSFTAECIFDLLYRIQSGSLQHYYGSSLNEEEKLSASASLLRGIFSGSSLNP